MSQVSKLPRRRYFNYYYYCYVPLQVKLKVGVEGNSTALTSSNIPRSPQQRTLCPTSPALWNRLRTPSTRTCP